MSDPKPGWTIEAAVQLLKDGYSPEQVERMTGFHARHVAAQAAAQEKALSRPRQNVVVTPPPARPADAAASPASGAGTDAPSEPFWPDFDE